jgi:hypothetical protein
MDINRMMRLVAAGYYDNYTDMYWNYKKQQPNKNPGASGDGLAKFIVHEVDSCFEHDQDSSTQVCRIIDCLDKAINDIEGVIDSLRSYKGDFVFEEAT